MNVSQKVKPDSAAAAQNKPFTSVFRDNEQMTHQHSLLFIKKLLAVAISNITYLRAVFPEAAYSERFIDDYRLKVLCENNRCPGACTLINWIRACFEAMDKKYLKQLTMVVFTDANNEDTVIESYSFTFCYKDSATMEIRRNKDRVLTAQGSSELKKETMSLLRTLVVLMQFLNPLPKQVLFSMKLLYYDDVTPADYEPKGFIPGNWNSFQFSIMPVNIRVGQVNTPFHSLNLKVKTDASQFGEATEEGTVEDERSTAVNPPTSTAVSDQSSVQSIEPAEASEKVNTPATTQSASETPLPPEIPLPSDEHARSLSTMLEVVNLIANVDIKEEKPFISQETYRQKEIIVVDLTSSPESSPKRPQEPRVQVADLAKKTKLSLAMRELLDSSNKDHATMVKKENRLTKRARALKNVFEFDEENASSQQSEEMSFNEAGHRCSKRRKCSNPGKPWLAKYSTSSA